MIRLIDVHGGVAVGRSLVLVGAIDGAVDGDIAGIGVGAMFHASHIDLGVAPDEGATAAAVNGGCIVAVVNADGAAIQFDSVLPMSEN